jgi:hypothetical protein
MIPSSNQDGVDGGVGSTFAGAARGGRGADAGVADGVGRAKKEAADD